MLLAALGLPCFRAPLDDGVGEPMLEAPREISHIAGRNACYGGRPRPRLSTPERCLHMAGGGGQNRHQPARKVVVRANIPGGDAVVDRRRSGPRDALSDGNFARCHTAGTQRPSRNTPSTRRECGRVGSGPRDQSGNATTHKPEKGVHLVPPRHECIRTIEQNRWFKL